VLQSHSISLAGLRNSFTLDQLINGWHVLVETGLN
jgi:hypothetical protein